MNSRELARRTDNSIVLNQAALRAAWRISDFATSDNQLLTIQFSCTIRAIDNPTERAMLAEAFLSHCETASVDDVISRLLPALRTAATKIASRLSVEDALTTDFVSPLKTAGDAIAFSCGIELLPPFECHVESPTHEQQKLESLQRQLAERRAAGQVEHFQRARELLKEFQAMRDAEPGLSPSRILQNISDADRGPMLQTLLLAGSDGEGASLFAVSGESLVRVDPRVMPSKIQTIPLPTTLGPMRSVRSGEIDGETKLLVGARSGIFVVNRDGSDPQTYAAPEIQSALGFNSVAVALGEIWASHSEAGGPVGASANPSRLGKEVKSAHRT